MRALSSSLVVLVLTACSTDTGADTAESADTTPCGISATPSIPDGASGVFGGAPLRVTLSAPDPGATITASFPGSLSWSDDVTMLYTPTPPLDPLASVTATITTCAGSSDIGWTTADVGGPLDAGVDLAATGYRVDLASGTVRVPSTGPALVSFLSGQGTELLLGATPTGAGDLDFRLAVTVDGVQDPCSRTLDLPGGTLDRGYFAFMAPSASFEVLDTLVELEDLSFSGAFTRDGSALVGGALHGWIGVHALAVAYAEGDDARACDFFGSLGAPCVPCPSGAGQCLELEVDDLSGTRTGTPVVAVTEACPER